MKTHNLVATLLIAILLCMHNTASAFQLDAVGTAAERKFAKRQGFMIRSEVSLGEALSHNFSEPVHESLTQITFGCDYGWKFCADPDLEYAGPYVIAGNRWNDDPPFMLDDDDSDSRCDSKKTISFVTQTTCWGALFKKAEKKVGADPTAFMQPDKTNYMLRSHFGDLLFLHAMASRDAEPPQETKKKILMWAEFTWGVFNGTYGSKKGLSFIEIDGWRQYFGNNNHNIAELFALERPWLHAHIREVALGSLLHMIQDSFAEGHVQRNDAVQGPSCRDNGQDSFSPIKQFHYYAAQNASLHKKADSAAAAKRHLEQNSLNAVEAGRQLLEYIITRNTAWDTVYNYLDQCVFVLDTDAQPAGPGESFIKPYTEEDYSNAYYNSPLLYR